MEQGNDLWSILAPIIRFFEGMAYGTLEESVNVAMPENSAGYFVPEQTQAIVTVVEEVERGWTMTTILNVWGPLFPLALFIALLAGTGILYCAMRLLQIRREERIALIRAAQAPEITDLSRTQLRWQRIHESLESDEPAKWRVAILEADILLNDLLDALGYKGETMADKMKQVDVSAFNTVDFAWEAHKIRNMIAHEAEYVLEAREARRIIRMYERVFKEFKYIE